MLVKSAVSLVWLLIVPQSPSSLGDSCLSEHYYGTQGRNSIFLPGDACVAASTDSGLLTGHKVTLAIEKHPDRHLIWIEREAVDSSILPTPHGNELEVFIQHLLNPASNEPEISYAQQQVLGGGRKREIGLLTMAEEFAVIEVNSIVAQEVDNLLPRFLKYTVLPASPVPYIPVPSNAVDRVRNILAKVRFDPVVASIVNSISVPQMRNDIRFLTGEDPKSGILTRHSFSHGALVAANWLKERIEDTGASCQLKPFLPGYAPNVICSYPSTVDTTETILLSAHYDSRGSFGNTRAPGGDDDGSGTTALLAIARTIARKGITFRKNVQLCAFAGEEQGLRGSRAYARELRAADANLTLMIQADMLAYHVPGEPAQLGLPEWIGTPEVAQLVANVSAIYSPELRIGFTSACCSDHQSFHEQGFPATQVFERAGPIADPMYHNSGDLSDREGYDLEQVKSIAKVELATLLHSAGFDLPDLE